MLNPAHIRNTLGGHAVRIIQREELQPAAVLLPLYVREGKDYVLFTRRAESLNHHRGEIAFPGGRRHPEDADLLGTALRETDEEMGIRPADVSIFGRLDDFVSIHGYRVTPYVGAFPWPYSFRVNKEEIAEVIEIPLAELTDPAICRSEDWTHKGRPHPVYFYTVGETVIWGLTAAILRQFLQLVGA